MPQSRTIRCSLRTLDLGIRADEEADIASGHAFCHPRAQPISHSVDLLFFIAEETDHWLGAIEHRHGATPILSVAVHVRHFWAQ